MITNLNFCTPCICIFLCSLIPDQIILSVCITPHCKLHTTDFPKRICIFYRGSVFLFFPICIRYTYFGLHFAYIFACTVHKLHDTVFGSYICMDIIYCILIVILCLHNHFIAAITLFICLIPHNITLICLAPNWNIYCIDA